ncbi:hypothetical protein SISSUDRAFT_747617 [Sistotremastrum suecicum HHB10207 ss-3]|uniref:Uncharacterized protein n=1 Tax=Sistotremastrum suecicum HHB10207 ss-3 TaxID=1314776 RepID=A0A166HYU2_9AGAM|nr:hypothetical protein SISSUDRAFT_747617 [Sistotremastrum suecicum HHB10207 ss-3]
MLPRVRFTRTSEFPQTHRYWIYRTRISCNPTLIRRRWAIVLSWIDSIRLPSLQSGWSKCPDTEERIFRFERVDSDPSEVPAMQIEGGITRQIFHLPKDIFDLLDPTKQAEWVRIFEHPAVLDGADDMNALIRDIIFIIMCCVPGLITIEERDNQGKTWQRGTPPTVWVHQNLVHVRELLGKEVQKGADGVP